MNDTNLKDLSQVRQFVQGAAPIEFEPVGQAERYSWVAVTLKRFDYFQLCKGDRGTIWAYLSKGSGYSRAQLNRLILQYKKERWIGRRRRPRHCFPRRYTREDILLLAETDEAHQTLSGGATKKLFERGIQIFKDRRYERLSTISVGHLYNLRKSVTYQTKRRHFTKTQRSSVTIGERRKPMPNGAAGYLRIDTVHQGDEDKTKGVYYINAVDEVTQMEVICAVEKISEQYLIPVLEQLIDLFPFNIKEIHSDNGSEYINHKVAKLLNKLLIELTKSRARRSNDNALVESKNGSLIRKWLGYCHIPQRYAPQINEFFKCYFVPYMNYHRPCYYVMTEVDEKTKKEKKKYLYKNMMTPYEKFKSLPDAQSYLKKGIVFADLDRLATQETDLDSAKKVRQAREKLFQMIGKKA